jgi:hypothetical protein
MFPGGLIFDAYCTGIAVPALEKVSRRPAAKQALLKCFSGVRLRATFGVSTAGNLKNAFRQGFLACRPERDLLGAD